MKIPLSKPDISVNDQRTILRTIGKSLKSGRIARGPIVSQFEQEFDEFLDVRHSLAVSSGTAALHLALLAHGIGQSDVVLTTPFSFISTANSILYVGGKPKFVDIDPKTYNIDPGKILEAIDAKTRALIVTHVFGLPCDMRPIMEICEDHKIVLIEDSCEALGATCNGRKVGTFSTSCFSFYPNKVVTTGEGGMVCTDDDAVAAKVDSLRNQGRRGGEWLEHAYVGYNYRLSDVQAAIGIPLLRKVDRLNSIREKKARVYTEAFRDFPQIRIPADVKGRTWFVYVVEVQDRDRVGMQLNKEGIECRPYFPSIHLQEPYRQLGYRDGDYPVCESVSKRVLALPFFTGMTAPQIHYVVESLGRLVTDAEIVAGDS